MKAIQLIVAITIAAVLSGCVAYPIGHGGGYRGGGGSHHHGGGHHR